MSSYVLFMYSSRTVRLDWLTSQQLPVSRCSLRNFFQVRWLENVSVATRALELLDKVKTYVTDKSGVLPKTVTCKNIKKACSDLLLRSKTQFFISVASMVEPFLRKYQTDKPI